MHTPKKFTAQFLFEQFFSIFSMEKPLLIKSMVPMGVFTAYLYIITLLSWASDTTMSYFFHTNNGGLIFFSFLMSCSVYIYAICFYAFLFILYGKDPLTQKHVIFSQIKRKSKELFFFQLFVLINCIVVSILYQVFFSSTGFLSLIIGVIIFFIYSLIMTGILFFNTFGIFIKNKTFIESTADSIICTAVYLNIVFAMLFLFFMLLSLSFVTLFLGLVFLIYTIFYLQVKVGIPLAEEELKNIAETSTQLDSTKTESTASE